MAHFTKISEQNEVLQVVTLNDSDMLNEDGLEDESVGQQYLQKHNNWPSHLWIQTSYNTKQNTHKSGDNTKAFRGNYAGIGYTWDNTNQIFWPPKPYPSWVKNVTNAKWESPLGDPPAFTTEQQTQINNSENAWAYIWDESVYDNDNTNGWTLVDLSS
jgi:hypothetical protein